MTIEELIETKKGYEQNKINYCQKMDNRILEIDDLILQARNRGEKTKAEIEAERIPKEVKRKDPPTEADGSMD